MTGWIDRQRRTVAEVAAALGRAGDPRRGYECTACNEATRDGRRGAVVVGPNGGWKCYRCNACGDGLDYLSYALNGHRLRDASDTDRRTVRDWCGEAPAPRPVAPPPPPKHADVSSFWASCYPCPSGDPFLTARGYRNVSPSLARFTPPASAAYPEWWPVGRAQTWRLVTRGWTADGRAVNLHGRAVVEPPEHNGRRIKTVWAKGLDSRALVFWNQRPPAAGGLVVIAEGLTDWLALSCWAEYREPVTVYGLTSGGADAFASIAIPDTADLIIATDDDAAGNDYVARIASHYRHRRIHRARPSKVATT